MRQCGAVPCTSTSAAKQLGQIYNASWWHTVLDCAALKMAREATELPLIQMSLGRSQPLEHAALWGGILPA